MLSNVDTLHQNKPTRLHNTYFKQLHPQSVKRLVIFLMLQFLAVSVKKFTDLWDVTPCCLVEIQHNVGGISWLHLWGRRLFFPEDVGRRFLQRFLNLYQQILCHVLEDSALQGKYLFCFTKSNVFTVSAYHQKRHC